METEIKAAKELWEAIYALNRALDHFEVGSIEWIELTEAKDTVWSIGAAKWPHAFHG